MLRKRAAMGGVLSLLALIGMGEAWAVVYWDSGGDGIHWSDGDNWSTGNPPGSTDDVYISSTDDIEMDMTSTTIASLTVDGSAGGSLTIKTGKALTITGAFGSEDTTTYDLVMENGSSLSADSLSLLDVTMVGGASTTTVTVADGILGGSVEAGANCEVTADGTSTCPTWTATGATILLEDLDTYTDGDGVVIRLEDGAEFTIEDIGQLTFPDANSEIVYDGTGNHFYAGIAESDFIRWLYLPANTRIRAADADSLMTLHIAAENETVSRIYNPDNSYVREGWDTRGVDIEMVAVPIEEETQDLEAISLDFDPWFVACPVIFRDVPCMAAWRDLDVPADAGENATVYLTDWDNNQWEDGSNETGDGDEVGLFHDITIGSGRTVRFTINNARVLYYWGSLDIDGTIEYDDGQSVTTVPSGQYGNYFVPAVNTLF